MVVINLTLLRHKFNKNYTSTLAPKAFSIFAKSLWGTRHTDFYFPTTHIHMPYACTYTHFSPFDIAIWLG